MPIMTGFHALKDLPEEKVTDPDVIDVFSPPRADFMPGTAAPAYMQEG